MLNIAVRAARSAGNIIVRAFEEADAIEVTEKGLNDFVSNIDHAAEKAIVAVLRKSYPEHGIVTEEAGILDGSDNDYLWIVDPLDGTTNFLKGFPHFAVSIALKVKGKIEHAVVFDPMRNELFTASRGRGARLNDYRLRLPRRKNLDGAILGTGIPFKQPRHQPAYLAMLGALLNHCADIRRTGSAALDLAYVAAGRLDGFFEIGLKPWDTAAGELLVKEAGGLVCDFSGGTDQQQQGNYVAGNTKVVQQILTVIRPHLTPELKK